MIQIDSFNPMSRENTEIKNTIPDRSDQTSLFDLFTLTLCL